MKLTVFSHKSCWPCANSRTGFATDGGFPIQMQALSELFDETRLLVPVKDQAGTKGEMPLAGHHLAVVPLTTRSGTGLTSKLSFIPWLLRNATTMVRELRSADAIHAIIPGDVGTAGMLLAWLFRKPLFVRHCGNWLVPATAAERFWRWFMETFAGGRNVMLATGGTAEPPSAKTPDVRWIFSTSLTQVELSAYAYPRPCPSDAGVRLIIVARQERTKGAATVIQSLPLLSKIFPGVSFDIVGEGSALPALKQVALDLGLSGQVRFSGKLNHEQVMQHLRAAHLFVFPTTSSDGFPKVVLEALASGLPVVATTVSVLPQLLGNGCGVLVDEATPEAVARGIEQALSNPARYEAMSLKAIDTARQYSLEAWRDQIGKLLTNAWGPLKNDKPVVNSPVVRRQASRPIAPQSH